MKAPFARLIILLGLLAATIFNQTHQSVFAQTGEPTVHPTGDGSEVEVSVEVGGGAGTPGTPPSSGVPGNPSLPGAPGTPPITDPGIPDVPPGGAGGGPAAGTGAGAGPAPVLILTCVQQADGSYADIEYLLAGGSWWQNKITAADPATCVKTPTVTGLEEPCTPTAANGTGTVTFDCTGDANTRFSWLVSARVSSACPVNRVLRHPYPRALVSMDTQFLLQPDPWGTGGESGNWSNGVDMPGLVEDQGRPTGLNQYKAVTIGVRSFRFNDNEKWFGKSVGKPLWLFKDDGRAGKYSKAQKGRIAVFAYEGSSFYGEKKGRAFDFDTKLPSQEYNLPALPVGITTMCGHQWGMKWKVSTDDSFCDGAAAGDFSACLNAGGQWKTRYKWDDKSYAWTDINLTKYGLPDPYAKITAATGGGVFQNKTYWDAPSGGIWVPVIEVQSILVRKCVYDGTCEPPQAP